MNENKINTLFELMLLGIITAFGALLIVVATLSKWNNNIELWTFFAVAICWGAYLLDIGRRSSRLILYVVSMSFILIYYGTGPVSFTDVPIILCLYIIVVSIGEDIRLQHILLFVYPFLIVYHFITGYVGPGMGSLVFARIVLGLFCITGAYLFSHYVMLLLKDKHKKIDMLERKLGESEMENESFISNVSHELLTPINAVNGISQIVMHKNLTKELMNDMNVIYSAGRRLNSQISCIMDYSEILSNDLILCEGEYSITCVVDDVLANFVWLDSYDDIEYAIDVDPDIPSSLLGDSEKIRKILSILVDNSFKFTEQGGVFVHISKSDESYGINLIFDFFDTGRGIDEDELKQLYKSFGDYTIASKNKSGIGIGMVIVYAFVDAMGGSIKIDSDRGAGSHIRVSIPQKVINARPAIYLQNPEKLRVISYLNNEKFANKSVGKQTFEMGERLRKKIGILIEPVNSLDELKECAHRIEPTHIFITKWEYDMDPDYYENMDSSIQLMVFVNRNFEKPSDSRMILIKKPFYMPAVINRLSEDNAGNECYLCEEMDIRFDGVRVLAVDDDNMNLVVLKGILENYGVSVETAQSGEAAVSKCQLEDFDLVFMDVLMPEMDGIECMNRIRKIRNNSRAVTPVVALTANASSGAKDQYIKEGFDEYMTKPIEVSCLIRCLNKYCRKERA